MSAEPKPDLQLEIAHLLLIDVVGYSKLLVNEQIDLIQELNRVVRSTACFQAAQSQGKLIRVPTGDGMALIFFRSPEEPARCAIEISEALKLHPEIQVRMGVHSGPVNQVTDVNDQVNVAGTGINVAQRVMDCGDAGHILLSKHIAEDLAQYGHWSPYLHDLGEYEVKHGLRLHIVNLCKDGAGNPALPQKLRRSKPWQRRTAATVKPVSGPRWLRTLLAVALALSVFALIISLLILFRRGTLTKTPKTALQVPEKSIAVLPFENRSEEKANAYIADGIQDEILTRLAKIADLKVISRTSTQHYKSTPENLPEIARQLGVAHILEGSVQKIGDKLRVNAQLIKAANDSHLWADTLDRNLTDIFAVETDIAKAVADQLRVHLTGPEEQVITARPTDRSDAYDAYLRGLSYTLKAATTSANALGAQKHLREAVRLDPKFAQSWALLSYVDALSYLSSSLERTVALREEARDAAETALSLQPHLGEALHAMGFYHYACLKDYDTAVRYFEQARQVLPNSSRIPESLASLARRRGEWERSDALFSEAEQLDPRNVSLLTQHALSFVLTRRFTDGLRKLDQVLEIVPNDADTLVAQAAIAQAEGELPRASGLLAPLRPEAADSRALETQAYQAILERHTAPIIDRLKSLLGSADPGLGQINSHLRFWLGWAQKIGGDEAGARVTLERTRTELEQLAAQQPENSSLVADLALTNLELENTGVALDLAHRCAAMVPIEKDAVDGPQPVEIQARVEARMGHNDAAVAILERLLSTSYEGPLASGLPITPALLRLDPMFDPIRKDPRFVKLAAGEQK